METITENQGIVYNKPSVASWTLSGVSHREKTGTYELIGEMTPSMTQDKLISKYGLEIPSTDLVEAIVSKGYELRNENPEASETLRQFLRQGFRQYPNTSTRIFYQPEGKDKIIHNYRTSDEYSIDAGVVGQDNWMDKIEDKSILESLLGTQDVVKINKIFQWVNGTNSYLWRLNSKPKETVDERVAGFDPIDDRLNLYCNRYPLGEGPAFRVLKVD